MKSCIIFHYQKRKEKEAYSQEEEVFTETQILEVISHRPGLRDEEGIVEGFRNVVDCSTPFLSTKNRGSVLPGPPGTKAENRQALEGRWGLAGGTAHLLGYVFTKQKLVDCLICVIHVSRAGTE